ncbi:LytTR family DNA-binding domain-containing protein [Eubacterium sp. MSJ-13]|uniref:LytR/AlgR family response regulator transcription factor n=1 Tax=Eubacterium sp. MSJ-13 TaxID=2841513 RepID=UPI0020A0B552|nr:LytTR family DNA-binding domain-containing protein [Eubacterium sp. MSJ-13]
MTIDIAVCDDDSKDLENTTDMVRDILVEYNDMYSLQIFHSAADMLNKVNKVDIAILDISMEEMNGIDLGRELKIRFPEVSVIYTTSYEQYCMQAVNEVHAYSFLCKPLQRQEVKNQLEELVKKMKQSDNKMQKVFYKVHDSNGKEYPFIKLELQNIIFFQYVKTKRRIAIVLENTIYEYYYVMEKLVGELEDYGFAVNCRGNLVNLRHISKMTYIWIMVRFWHYHKRGLASLKKR